MTNIKIETLTNDNSCTELSDTDDFQFTMSPWRDYETKSFNNKPFVPVWRSTTSKSTSKASLHSIDVISSNISINSSNNDISSITMQPTHSNAQAIKKRKDCKLKIKSINNETLDILKQENILYHHNNDKPWICKNCGRNYKWKNSLKCHLKNECGQPPKYFCARMCGYKTHIHSNLKRHLNSKFCKQF